MATNKKQKRAGRKTAANKPTKTAATRPMTDGDWLEFNYKRHLAQRDTERKDPTDAETRRRVLSAVCGLAAPRFAHFADAFEEIETEPELGQMVLDLYGVVESEIGLARSAEIFAAVLHRFEHTAGTDDRDEQLADDLLGVVEKWAYGARSHPAGELVRVEPGMRANGCPQSLNEADGLVLSTTPHGCFIRDDATGCIVGLHWNTVRLYAAGSTIERELPDPDQADEAAA